MTHGAPSGLASDDPNERAAAIREVAARDLGGDEVTRALVAALDDDRTATWLVRSWTHWDPEDGPYPVPVPLTRSVADLAIETLWKRRGSHRAAVAMVEATFASAPADRRAAVVRRLGWLLPASEGVVFRALEDPDPGVRVAAVDAVSRGAPTLARWGPLLARAVEGLADPGVGAAWSAFLRAHDASWTTPGRSALRDAVREGGPDSAERARWLASVHPAAVRCGLACAACVAATDASAESTVEARLAGTIDADARLVLDILVLDAPVVLDRIRARSRATADAIVAVVVAELAGAARTSTFALATRLAGETSVTAALVEHLERGGGVRARDAVLAHLDRAPPELAVVRRVVGLAASRHELASESTLRQLARAEGAAFVEVAASVVTAERVFSPAFRPFVAALPAAGAPAQRLVPALEALRARHEGKRGRVMAVAIDGIRALGVGAR